MRRLRTTGFTLVEVVVALAVIGIALGAVISVAAESARSVATLRDRLVANWVAENRLTELALLPVVPVLGDIKGNSKLGSRVWYWRQRTAQTEDGGLVSVSVAVFEQAEALSPGARRSPLVELTTLLAREQ